VLRLRPQTGHFQDQSEWQIEWQIVLARACLEFAIAGVRSRFAWSTAITCGN
jgi:hypothetical protein